MQKENLHFYLSAAIMMLGFFVLFGLFIVEPFEVSIEGHIIGEKQYCEDNTPVGECSDKDIGNICRLTKKGPALRFSEKCYN